MANTPYHLGQTGAPLIDGCISHVECRTWATYDGGDHTIFVGEVIEAEELSDGEPLVFYAGQFGRLMADSAPS